MIICKSVQQEITEAASNAFAFCADWRDDDYVGFICDREGLDIDSPEVNNIVFQAQSDFNLGIL